MIGRLRSLAHGFADEALSGFTRPRLYPDGLGDLERLEQLVDFGTRTRAREFFARCLEPVDARRFPAPRCTRLAVIVASSFDRFVRREETQALHEHWPGSELRFIEAGHLTGALRTTAHIDAIRDAFARFEQP